MKSNNEKDGTDWPVLWLKKSEHRYDLKQVIVDFTTTAVFESSQHFGWLKTDPVIMCLNLLIYILSKLQPLQITQNLIMKQPYHVLLK